MIATLDTISQDMQEDILALFNKGVDIVDLMEIFTMDYNELLALINAKDPKSSLIKPAISQYDFKDNDFIVISDTHLGSYLDNPAYLESVYEFARINNISLILHTGDFFQSTRRPVNKKYQDLKKQLAYGIDSYPKDEHISNYILFGNHDYHMMYDHEEYYKIVASRKDFNILGFKKAYFTWAKKLMMAYHSLSKYPLTIPNYEPFLRISGHRHGLKVILDHTIYTPTLSDDIKNYGEPNHPGFLVIKKAGDKMKVMHYIVLDFHDVDNKLSTSGISIFPQGVVLSKHL